MSENEKIQNSLHNFDLASFKRSQEALVEKNEASYGTSHRTYFNERLRTYTEEEVKQIIDSGTLTDQQRLSQAFFLKDGYYRQLILYYATLLKYQGILIPIPTQGKKLSTSHIQKRYFNAVDFVEELNISLFGPECARRVLTNGASYYAILEKNKNIYIIDLPNSHCMSRYKDIFGNDIVEFNLSYFNSIDECIRKDVLASYPSFISKSYDKWRKGKLNSSWVKLPSDVGFCFSMFDGRPFFLSVIPSTIQYDEAVETEQEKNKEEIRKILIQRIPHLTDGRLLFEPEEMIEMHNGAVGMVRNNKNTTVLTTYADVDVANYKTSADTADNVLEKMVQNIYSQAGVSSEIFAATGGNTTETSIKYDTAIMMYIANKISNFVTNVVNKIYSNSNIHFKYNILPITYQNESKYVDENYKLASSGYSLLVPALAQGFSQRELAGIKELENDVLKLTEVLIAPKTSFTSSNADEGGRPTKETEEKKDQTLENEKSVEISKTQGGSE